MNEGRKECRKERKLTHKKIDRALEGSQDIQKKVWRFLLVICGPNGVVRKGGREGWRGETREVGHNGRGVALTWQHARDA